MDARIEPMPHGVFVSSHRMHGVLRVPPNATGLVIFAHDSASGRISSQTLQTTAELSRNHMASLLIDVLSEAEVENPLHVSDSRVLATRLASAAAWAREQSELHALPIGLFGAGTGAAAALAAAAQDQRIAVLVTRSGRPDLVREALPQVRAPTLLLVGSLDGPVIDLNRQAFAALNCPKKILIVPGAGHLFEEPGVFDQAVAHAIAWFATGFARHDGRAG